MSQNTSMRRPLAKLLRDGMVRNNFTTTRDIAKRVNLSEEHIRRMLRGDAVPTDAILEMICELVGVEYSEAHALAVEQRNEEALMEYAMRNEDFRSMVQLWKTDPSITDLVNQMVEDQELYMLVKIWNMLSVDKKGILFKAAVTLQTRKQATAA